MIRTYSSPELFDMANANLSSGRGRAAHQRTVQVTGDDCGSFIQESRAHEMEAEVEDVERYAEASDYPIKIGEVLASRFCVEHKLGHGASSTVWLAHDMHRKRDVALKILQPGDAAELELDMQDLIKERIPDALAKGLVTYEEVFSLRAAPNCGFHRVMVMPVQGPPLLSLLGEQPNKPQHVKMRAALNLLKAIKSLHDVEIVHRGKFSSPPDTSNITGSNVTYGMRPFAKGTTRSEKYELLSRPCKMQLDSDIWKQGEVVRPMDFPKDLVTNDVFLCDFGHAILEGTDVGENKAQMPAMYCAPERLHGVNPNSASDMWSFMCVFAELYSGYSFFGTTNSHFGIMNQMVRTLGPLPRAWKGSFPPHKTVWYDGRALTEDCWVEITRAQNWWYNHQMPQAPETSLEAKLLRRRPDLDPRERAFALAVFRKGFTYDPEQRPAAAHLLQDEDFTGLMEYYGL